jgi:DNA-binding CsgD family transcriptional regulator
MERFWMWLREYANQKVRESYKFGLDLRCDHCLRWISEGFPLKQMRDRETLNPVTTCGHCGRDTHWTDVGIIWVRRDPPALPN